MQNAQSDVSRPFYRKCVVAISLAMIALLLFALTVKVSEDRSDKRLMECRRRLGEIGIAISRFYRATGSLPPACVRDNHGNPLFSGRVLLLPYLGAQDVYDRVNQREPWDSEHNRLALRSRTDLAVRFHCPADRGEKNDDSSYVFVTGCDIRLPPGDCGSEPIEGLPRDETNTVLMIEVVNWGINWAEPQDATADDICRLIRQHGVASPHGFDMHVLLRDGRVVTLHTDYFVEILDRSMNDSSKTRKARVSRGSGSGRSPVHN